MRLKLPNLNRLAIGFTLIIASSIIFSLVIIALPQTERLLPDARYDLNLSENTTWKKEYTLQLLIKDADLTYKDQKIRETKEILYKRLSKYGVEEVTIVTNEGDKKTEPSLKVTIQSSKDEALVDTLVQQRYFMRIVTRKEGVDFNNEDDPLTTFNPENYDPTPFTRRYFRTVYITELQNNSGEDSYFAIFKPWLLSSQEFDEFVQQNAARQAGLSIDGFVVPITIPVGSPTHQVGSTKPVFSVGLSLEESQAEVTNILMNSGVIPVEYTTAQTEDLTPVTYEISYLQALLSVSLVMILTVTFMKIQKIENIVASYLLPIALLYAVWMTFLKLTQTPTTLSIQVLEFLTILPVLFLISKFQGRKEVAFLSSTVIFGLIYLLGFGYARQFGYDMALLTIFSAITFWATDWYLNMTRRLMV